MKIRRIYTILILWCFIPVTGWAQVGGKYIYNFLNFNTSSRQAALGGTLDWLMPCWNASPSQDLAWGCALWAK